MGATLIDKFTVKSKKGKFLYSIVPTPQEWSKLLPGSPVQSNTILVASSHLAINMRRLFVHKYSLLLIAMYSFIQLRELQHCRVKKTCQRFDTVTQDSNTGSIT